MATKPVFTYVKKFELCDRDHFLIVKGISILAGLMAFFCENYLDGPQLTPVVRAAMALFLLCSGFGVSESYIKKRGLIHYWENKMTNTWLPSLVVLVIIAIFQYGNPIAWIVYYPVALKGNLMYLLFGEYIIFWLLFRLVKNRTVRIACLFGCSTVAFALIPESLEVKELLFCFPFGALFSQAGWKRNVREYTWKGKSLLFFGCMAVAVAMWFLAQWLTIPYVGSLIWSVFHLCAAATLLFGVWMAQAVPVFGIFVPAGMISYMIYLLYDTVFQLLEKKSDWRTDILLFAILFAASGVMTWLRKLLINWNKNLRRKGKTQLKGSM